MEKYSSADREMYSQFKKVEAHPMEKYIGRLAKLSDDELKLMGYGCDELSATGCSCNELEVVGYTCREREDEDFLIVDASQSGGWSGRDLEPSDFAVKECKYYWYVNISDLIVLKK